MGRENVLNLMDLWETALVDIFINVYPAPPHCSISQQAPTRKKTQILKKKNPSQLVWRRRVAEETMKNHFIFLASSTERFRYMRI